MAFLLPPDIPTIWCFYYSLLLLLFLKESIVLFWGGGGTGAVMEATQTHWLSQKKEDFQE